MDYLAIDVGWRSCQEKTILLCDPMMVNQLYRMVSSMVKVLARREKRKSKKD